MPRKTRRIRDSLVIEKDHARYRLVIENDGWAPFILADKDAAYWDASTVRDKHGHVFTAISLPARNQLIKMILAGRFGDDIRDAIIDHARYERIQDDLINWPNKEIIAKDTLHVVDLRPT